MNYVELLFVSVSQSNLDVKVDSGTVLLHLNLTQVRDETAISHILSNNHCLSLSLTKPN